MNHPTERIIQGCRRQERSAQKALFDAYAVSMMALCCRYLKSPLDAEEAMLSGFTKFFSTIARFVYTDEGSIQAWLRKIIVNECLTTLRRHAKMFFVNEDQAVAASDDQDSVLDRLSAAEIRLHIDALPDGYRTVFNLYVIEGYTHKEIAGLLDISEGTSRSQLSKARALLQSKIIRNGQGYEAATER